MEPPPGPVAGPRHVTAPADRVPFLQNAAASLGGITETLSSHGIRRLAAPILNLALGLSPALVGLALALPRLWDALIDPLIGNWSDNLRCPMGRRRPFMLIGALVGGIVFTLVWWFPLRASGGHYFWHFLIGSLLFYTAIGFFIIPWEALLVELSNDYHERTRVQAFRSMTATFGALCLPWLFAATQYPPFGGSIPGVRRVGVGTGALMAICGLLAAIGVREKAPPPPTRAPGGVLAGLRAAAGNRPFLIIILLMILYGPGLMVTEGLSLYVNIFYVFGGKIAPASLWEGYQGTLIYAAKFVWIPVMTVVATRIGKRNALWLCFSLSLASDVLKWFCYAPAHPVWQLLIPLVQSPGMTPAWVLLASMLADTTDLEKRKHGTSRVGLLMSIAQWIQKAGITLAFALSGLVLSWSGFEIGKGVGQSTGAILHLRLLLCIVPAACTAAAMILLRFYSLTEEEVYRLRAGFPASEHP